MQTKILVPFLVVAIVAVIYLQASSILAQSGTWVSKAEMPDPPRGNFGMCAVNGILYATGGQKDGMGVLTNVDAYYPASNTWSNRAGMLTPRNYHQVIVFSNMLYAIGGCADNYCDSPLSSVEVYDPASNAWTSKAPMPATRRSFGAGVVNGIIYAVGGYVNEGYYPSATAIAYNPASNTWASVASMPHTRTDAGVAGINGILYVVGANADNRQVQAYNPASNSWTLKASLPMDLSFVNNSVSVVDGLLYCMSAGGSPVYVYNSVLDTWTTNAPVPGPFFSSFGVGTIDRTIYVAGGVGTNYALTKAMAAFTLDGQSTNTPATTNIFAYTGSVTNITLPPGTYDITAYGAQGGNGTGSGTSGGPGAKLQARFNLDLMASPEREAGV